MKKFLEEKFEDEKYFFGEVFWMEMKTNVGAVSRETVRYLKTPIAPGA